MATNDYEVAKHIATKCLKFKVDFDDEGKVFMELCNHRWDFKTLTDAEAIEEVSKVFKVLNECMWEVVNDVVFKWLAANKTNFN